jgi:orotate phosphoribosyltransferase
MPFIDSMLLATLRQQGLLKEGHFAFRSGRHSAGLLDRDLLLADPQIASRMGYTLAKRFFTEHIDTVAAPSIWGAGLAQWVGYFLEPKAKVVYATPRHDGTLTVADHLVDHIAGKRVLLIDNLVMTGETMRQFTDVIDGHGATVLGIGTLWNATDQYILQHPVTGLLNPIYEAFPIDQCPICASGTLPAENAPY